MPALRSMIFVFRKIWGVKFLPQSIGKLLNRCRDNCMRQTYKNIIKIYLFIHFPAFFLILSSSPLVGITLVSAVA